MSIDPFPLPLLLLLISAQLMFFARAQTVYNVSAQGECADMGDGTNIANCNYTSSPAPIIFVHGFLGSKMHLDQLADNVPFPPELEVACWGVLGTGLVPLLFGTPRFSMKGWINPVLAFGNTTMPQNPATVQACLLYLMQLKYDNATNSYSNRTNVATTFESRQPFGSNCPVTCWASDSMPGVCKNLSTQPGRQEEAYFNLLIEGCLSKIGYVRRCNLFSAPYDWRLTTDLDQMQAYFTKLTNIIETAVNATGKKAILMAHSMGNLVVLNFLNQQKSAEWQQQYLNSTFNVAAPYGGTTFILEQIISGNIDRLFPGFSFIVTNQVIRTFLRTFASIAALLANSLSLPTEKLVTVNGTDYTVNNMSALLALIGLEHIHGRYQNLKQDIQPQQNTDMYCLYSCTPNNTPVYFNYGNGIDQPPTGTGVGDGDSVVHCQSLRVCKGWFDNSTNTKVKQVVDFGGATGPTHVGIFNHAPFCTFIKNFLGITTSG